MNIMPYIASFAIRLVPLLAVAMFQLTILDAAFAAVIGKRVENYYSRPDAAGGKRTGLLVERPIDKPLPPVGRGRGGKESSGHHGSERRWREGRHRDHDHRYFRRSKLSRYQSPPIFRRGVVGPAPAVTGR